MTAAGELVTPPSYEMGMARPTWTAGSGRAAVPDSFHGEPARSTAAKTATTLELGDQGPREDRGARLCRCHSASMTPHL